MKILIVIIILIGQLSYVFCDEKDLESVYNKAKEQQKRSKFKPQLQKLADQHPDNKYGQLALLDLAKLSLLERDYQTAISHLKKIHHPLIEDKQLWMAKAYLKNEQFHLAIISAQIYISDAEDQHNLELAYFVMAEAYLQKHDYKKALEILEELRLSEYIADNIPLLYYMMGNCCELLSDFTSALVYYRKLKQEFPYNQYSYLADERIYKLKSDEKVDVDLTTFSSYRLVDPDSKPGNLQQKEEKLYLQVGAFSSKENAEKLGKKVKKIGYKYSIFSKIKNNKKLNVVLVGPFENENKMAEAMKKLEANGISSFMIKRYE